MGAGEIDAVLTNKGYSVPVPPTYPEAYNFLNNINAHIALHLMERAAPTSRILEHAAGSHQSMMQMLVDAETIMDVPKDVQRAEPRGPGVTTAGNVSDHAYQPTGPFGRTRDCSNAPMFTRSMEF